MADRLLLDQLNDAFVAYKQAESVYTKLREEILHEMLSEGVANQDAENVRVTLVRQPPKVEGYDVEALPEGYWKKAPNLAALRKAIVEDANFPYATMVESMPTIKVEWRKNDE